MTPNKVIEIVDGIKPNVYDEETKFRWINELEGIVVRKVIQDDNYIPYEYPKDGDKELIVPAPYDNVYGLYVEAMIDYYNKEIPNYNNSVAMFDATFTEYKKDYIRHHQAKG
jgi:hypothetical protein